MHHTPCTCLCPVPEEEKKKKAVTIAGSLFLNNLVLSSLSVIMFLHFSGFDGVLNLSKLSVEKQMSAWFLLTLASS